MGFFVLLAKLIALCPPLFAVIMPIISTIFIIVGLGDYKVEDRVGNIWIPEATRYAKKEDYKLDLGLEKTTTAVVVIGIPSSGGNVGTASRLLEIRDKLRLVQQTTVNVDGETWHLDDICSNPAASKTGQYKSPCFRMTVLDCFREGGYDFTAVHAAAWRALALPAAITQGMPAGVSGAVAAMETPLIKYGLVANPLACGGHCTNNGLPVQVAAALGQTAGTWESDAVCMACVNGAYSTMSPAVKDATYVTVATQILQTAVNSSVTVPYMKQYTGATTDKDAVNQFMMTFPPLKAKLEVAATPAVTAGATQQLSNMDPYMTRPQLQTATGQLANDSVVLQAMSGDCKNWDNGLALPSNVPALVYGTPVPEIGVYSTTNPLTSVKSFQTIYNMMIPKRIEDVPWDIVTRVAHPNRPAAWGGPRNISKDTAKDILYKMKETLEDRFNSGWNNNPNIQMTAFSDDAGAGGSFSRTLKEVTTDSLGIVVAFAIVTAVLAMVFFVTWDFIMSRIGLVFVGALMAILGCFATLGFASMCGMKLNVVHFWSLPFIITGIGIDDMFMLATSYKTAKKGEDPYQVWHLTYADVAVPVTMTSLVNCGMFLIMGVCSDIKAVYETGFTGLAGTVILYLTMMVSFAAMVCLDTQRRAAGRYDFLCCLKGKKPQEFGSELVSGLIYTKAFKPCISTFAGRICVLIVALALVIPAVIALCIGIDVGVDLSDFAPDDSALQEWADHHNKYFGSWFVRINWGEIDYRNPNVQMQMAKQFEQVIASPYIVSAPMPTKFVWTAAFAKWGSQPGTMSDCQATWVDNTMGLRLESDLGVCRVNPNDASKQQCPVMAGFSETQFQKCIGNWSELDALTFSGSAVPNFQLDRSAPPAQSRPKMPIKFSECTGNVLMAHKLFKTDDYVDMIKQTRIIVDDSSLDAWMAGVPFDFWEQYLTIVEVMLRISGLGIGIGFFVSASFLLIVFTGSQMGTCLQRTVASLLGALLLSLASGTALLCVVGWCALFQIKLSGFTATSCVLSTGLTVEYSVHIISRYLEAPMKKGWSAVDRVDKAMSWLFPPNAMAFTTTLVSVLMMGLSRFSFVRMYFFAPLAVAVIVSYFFGGIALPCLLGCLNFIPALDTERSTVIEKEPQDIFPKPSPDDKVAETNANMEWDEI